tara:strand:- start:14511 stop:14939 length:429 start_codon:yes stop_codon:yes gene_type:complete
MALADEVTARFPAERLKQLTNQGSRSASSINTTILGYAAADAVAEFELEVGTTFVLTDAAHVSAAIWGVIYHLESYAGAEGASLDKHRSRWQRETARLARLAGADMPLLPQTLSPLTYDEDLPERDPDNDRDAWADVILDRG